MTSVTTPERPYRPDIDALRAIAVLSVIAYHFDNGILPKGYLGVDIFFVISGYVITSSLASRHHPSFTAFISSFYAARIKRLVPALVTCIALTCVVGYLFIAPDTALFKSSWKAGVAALVGASNLYFLKVSTDYFGAFAGLNLFTQTWSLGVEEQFYFVFPIVIWLTGFSRAKSHAQTYLALTMVPLAVLSLVTYLWLSQSQQTAAFFLMPARFWELSVGCFTYMAVRAGYAAPRRFSQPAAALALLVLGLVLVSDASSQVLATVAAVACSAVIIGTVRPGDYVYTMLTLRPVVFVGLISYSLYLWHWSVLVISRWTIGVHWWSIPIQIAIIALLSLVSFLYIERPLRQRVWSPSRGKTIGYGLCGALSVAVFLAILGNPLRGMLYSGASARLAEKGVETLMNSKKENGLVVWRPDDCVLSANSEVGMTVDFNRCTIGGDKIAQRHFLIVGNSFSVAEYDMYTVLRDKGLGSVTVTSAWAASPAPHVPNSTPWSGSSAYYWDTVVPNLVSRLRRGDFVVMISAITNFSPMHASAKSEGRLRTLQRGLERFVRAMRDRGIGVIFQATNPFMFDAECDADMAKVQWFGSARCKYYSKKESLQRRRKLRAMLSALQTRYKNFQVLDLFPLFCPDRVCTYYDKKGMPLYRDIYAHPSVEASIRARPLFLKTVKKGIKDLRVDMSEAY